MLLSKNLPRCSKNSVTQKLYDTMTGMQWGKLPDTKGWIVPVEKKY